MNLPKLKNLFLKILIGCLVVAATIAVVTIIIGHFNGVFGRALASVLLVALHCLLSLGFIANNEKDDTFDNLAFFTNVTFFIIILSFITSISGVWGIIGGSLVARLYALYFVLLFASLHGEILAKTTNKQNNIDNVVYFNYFFMAIVVAMLIPVIFVSNSSTSLPSLYYRSLAAAGIIDTTLTIIAIVLHRLYVQKHPKLKDNMFNVQVPGQPGQTIQVALPVQQHHGMNIFVKIIIGYVLLQLAGSIFFLIVGALALHRT